LPSLRDVANLAGVSVTTASKVLNAPEKAGRFSDACIRRVREAAEKLGYHRHYHASILRSGKSLNIGVAFCLREVGNVLGGHFWGSVLGGVETTTRNAGYELTLTGPGPEGTGTALHRAVDHLRQRRIDGLIIPNQYDLGQMSSLVRSVDRPVVAIQYSQPTIVPVVRSDDNRGAEQAISHLAALGHRKVLWLGPANWDTGTHTHRLDAIKACCSQHGLELRTSQFPGEGHAWWRGRGAVVSAAEEHLRDSLSQKPDYTAIVCFNDWTAVGACHALQNAGLQPGGDISVIGFDNAVGDLTRPALTSVDLRFFQVGVRAAQLLLDLIDKRKTMEDLSGHLEMVEPELAVRDSTAPLR
jgi:DNA-binding LacI/PurR family transcriptional regulator